MFNTGAILHNRYTVERVLARGGMATVYIVRHNTLDTQYALKVLDIPTPEIRKRLLQEGRIQASLKHPNIVAVTDAIELNGSPALVMDYIDGPPLSQVIDEGAIPQEQAELWFRQIVSAVSYAHARGLIHRDLKPENVLMAPMTGGFLPKVADFGIAKVLQDYLRGDDGPRTQTGIGMGTPAYMPPEQVQNAGDVDHRADVFALGCILYELMCGHRAFPGDNLLSILNAIADGDYTPPWEHRNTLDERIVAAIDGALEPNVEQRIQTCEALLKVLRGDLQRPTKTPPPAGVRRVGGPRSSNQRVTRTGPTPPTSPPAQRGWMPWLLGGSAAAVAAIGLLGVAVVGLGVGGWYVGTQMGLSGDTGGLGKPPGPLGGVPGAPFNGGADTAEPAPPEPSVFIHGEPHPPMTIGPRPTEPVTPEPATPESTGPKLPTTPPPGIVQPAVQPEGVKVIQDPFDVRLTSWRIRPSTSNGVMRFAPEEGEVLYVARVVITRNDTTHDVNAFPWSLWDAYGNEYDAPLQCSMAMASAISPMHSYEPGETLDGNICFVGPADLQGPEVRFAPSWEDTETLRFPLE